MARDSDFDEECMIFLNILYDSADNPMVSECASHLGLNANKFCPCCKVGGDKKYKASNEGYHSLFDVSPLLDSLCVSTHIYSHISYT